MNANTVLLAMLVLIVAVVAGVWLNDRFEPFTPTPEEAARQRRLQKIEECAKISGFGDRYNHGCE